jgi:hypothetical protein
MRGDSGLARRGQSASSNGRRVTLWIPFKRTQPSGKNGKRECAKQAMYPKTSYQEYAAVTGLLALRRKPPYSLKDKAIWFAGSAIPETLPSCSAHPEKKAPGIDRIKHNYPAKYTETFILTRRT